MLKPKTDKKNKPVGSSPSAMQAVAEGMTRWLLMLVVGLGALGVWAGYMGRLLVASTLVSIVIVAFTLYLFLKYWPEEEKVGCKRNTAAPEPVARSAKIPVTRLNGPPRARFIMALKEVVRKQDAFRLSPQGAERFARTIRYMLRELD
jgi:hypothetical protein